MFELMGHVVKISVDVRKLTDIARCFNCEQVQFPSTKQGKQHVARKSRNF